MQPVPTRALGKAGERVSILGLGGWHLRLPPNDGAAARLVFDDEPDKHFTKGGVVEALDRARAQGKVRYVGFTGHNDLLEEALSGVGQRVANSRGESDSDDRPLTRAGDVWSLAWAAPRSPAKGPKLRTSSARSGSSRGGVRSA